MRIGMIGTGYVGLVSGTCFAEFGFHVTCVDNNAEKITGLNNGKVPIYEPGLESLIEKQVRENRIAFTTDLEATVKQSDVIFIAVGTPPRESDGHADLTFVYDVARAVARCLDGYKVIVTKSTVPVGTACEVERIIREENPDADFDVVSNPEFLREGAAIGDFMRPDRVVVGTQSARAQQVLEKVYRPLYLNETPIVFTSRETAEITKYAANAFLATKITFMNEIADLCEAAGGNVQEVARALGLDGRISGKFLHAGPGFGGSCFPKDTLALAQTGQKLGTPQKIVESVVSVNEDRKIRMAEKVIKACGGSVEGKKIGVLGVAFKPKTDDVRDAPSLKIIPHLQQAGGRIAAYDPEAMDEAAKHLSDVDWQDNAYAVADDADVLVIITEWNAFRALDLSVLKECMATPLIVDLRNIYGLSEMEQAGFRYISVGRNEIIPHDTATIRLASNNDA
ncbi:MAG: UDP-glucose/GDP-mannose dehydrogenase family protein [Alphaproteobacteria bacterium]|nr:UDP-glucose/GDP-mannose dehydrogenase family protein [Alphaproteobacteria bacterium]MDP7223380.1 UDP-glucose/GDP-mannose dehydrogenase family protein [Alphaproteobacteria bacterium]